MSDFTRSRGCGAPLFTSAAEEAALRSGSCAALTDRSCGCSDGCGESCSSTCCGCGESCPIARSSCPCGGDTGSGGSGGSGSDSEGCGCCKASMRRALKLLCCNQISDLLDFNGFAFVTDDLIVGAQPEMMCECSKDNLGPLCGTFRRFSPCNCDLIDIGGMAYGPFGCLVDVDQATLCSLSALVFQVQGESASCPGATPTVPVCECSTVPTTPGGRYLRVRSLLQCQLDRVDSDCGDCVCRCDCADNCCCADAVLAALSSMSMNKRATLVAGLLALRNVSVLGTIGNVLVLGNDTDNRFYFVCANKVEMLA